MKNLLRLVAVSAAVACSTSPASAALYMATFKGSVIYGRDGFGLFGDVGGSLTGQQYVATYTLDTSKGPYSSFSYPGAGSGESYETSVPFAQMVNAVLTINGKSLSVLGNGWSFAEAFNIDPANPDFHDGSTFLEYEIQDYTAFEQTGVYRQIGSYALLNVPVSLSNAAFDVPPFTNSGIDWGWGPVGAGAFEQVDVRNHVRTEIWFGGVPEPATWSLLITGFLALGQTLRVRRRLARA